MSEDDGIRIEVKPVPRTRAQGQRARRYVIAQKAAVLLLVAALVSVVVGSWGLQHHAAEFTGVVCGALAQQMLPPRLRWVTVGWICVTAGSVLAILDLLQK